jgi:uncharacterized GH25 family protein
MTRFLFAPILALLAAAPARAHDFWIEPSSFTPAPGELVKVTLWVGERLEGETMPRNDALIERFAAIGAHGEGPVVGLDGQDPAGLVRPAGTGGSMIVYRSLRSRVELDATKFEAYLEIEGLPKVSSGPEVFSRCAKALLAVGGKGSASFTQPAGLKLEIVPEADPYALALGASLPVRVLYEGKPLRNALVVAFDRASANEPQRIRTDAAGHARVALPRPGVWLIKAVHMIAAPSDAGAKWESFWASLTFRR